MSRHVIVSTDRVDVTVASDHYKNISTRSPSMVSGTYLGIGLELRQDCSYTVVVSLDVRESVGGDGGDIDLVHVCGISCCILSAARCN